VAREQSDEPTGTDEQESGRPASVDALWSAAGVDVVEIALPSGVGYTLRAYRSEDDVVTTDISEREADLFPNRHRPSGIYDHDEKAIRDEDADDDTQSHDFDADFRAEETPTEALAAVDDDDILDSDDDSDDDSDSDSDSDSEEDEDEDAEEESAAAEAEDDEDLAPEEIPIFLGHRGKLLLFKSAEGLVDFVRSDAPHDLTQLPKWSELAESITVDDVQPLSEDTYELDLVVSNLRGGRDSWDAELLVRAGEIARDIGRSFELQQVETALAAGSPLDDLDEALRASMTGGVGGFFGRRKLKKIGTEAAPLGWRTIIGKISGIADWRD